MSALALPRLAPEDGLMRAAHLMRALGAEGAPVWAELTPQEAHAISEQMTRLDTEDHAAQSGAVTAFVREMASDAAASPRPDAPQQPDPAHEAPVATMAALLARESAQVAAYILFRLESRQAAAIVRALPRSDALAILRRMIHFTPPSPHVAEAIETTFGAILKRLGERPAEGGEARVARIFDELGERDEDDLLTALDGDDPITAKRIRDKMFGFDDLAGFGPAGLQTLLANLDRALLVRALKGVAPEIAEAFFGNMTKRAAELLREDMAALGGVPRGEVEAARSQILAVARELLARGDIRPGAAEQDELIE